METQGSALSSLIMLIIIFLIIFLIFRAVRNGSKNKPTWEGIIISAVIGLLPIYLVLCYFGYMGEKRDMLNK